MDNDLICNFKKCRKPLNTFAWVTSCSHIFCDEDGSREFHKCFTCPACDTSLSGKFDVIRIDLQPSEQYKSMVLAGQRPDVILEICSRAMAFWTYQTHQERIYQEYVASKAKEKGSQLEEYYEQVLTRTQTELTSLKSQLSNAKKDLENTKRKLNEVSEKFMERNRQHSKLQSLYDSLRRRSIKPANFESEIRTDGMNRLDKSTGLDIWCRERGEAEKMMIPHSPAERDFVLRPNSTPLMGCPGEDQLMGMQARFVRHTPSFMMKK